MLQPFDSQTWLRIASSIAGRPAIVHLWGLSCAPCIEELPRWGAFMRSRPGATVLFIEADVSPAARVSRVLSRAGLAGARHWVSTEPFDERMRYAIDPQWGAELPRTLLIAADGGRRAFSGSADFSMLQRWLADGTR